MRCRGERENALPNLFHLHAPTVDAQERRSRSSVFLARHGGRGRVQTPEFHELRHTFVALWIAAGANPKEVSVRAGHSSVAFTLDRYGHLYQDTEDDIPER